MSQIINIRSESKHDETSDTRPSCHLSTSIDHDTTTVVILKTSSNESSSHYHLNSKLTASTVVLDASVLLSSGCSDIGLKSLEVQTSGRQQHVNLDNGQSTFNYGSYDKDKQQQLLSNLIIKDLNTLGSSKSSVVSTEAKGGICNVVSIAGNTSHRHGCKSVQPVKQTAQLSLTVKKNTDCRVDIANVGRQVYDAEYCLEGTAADIAYSNVCISSSAIQCSGDITSNKKTEFYNQKQATDCASKHEDLVPVDKRMCSALRSSNCSEADYPAVNIELKSIELASSPVECKLDATIIDRDKSKSCIIENPFSFTTSCAPDAVRFRFVCQSCLTVRFAAYWDLRLHEDWCGRRMPSSPGVSCLECGYRYKNLVLLHRHLVEIHGSGATANSALPHTPNVPSNTNPYCFTTVCARDAKDFPYVCASCKTVCFKQSDDMRRHEDWCGRNVSGSRTFVCGKCDVSFHSDVLLKRHGNECIEQVSSKDECCARNAVDSIPSKLFSVYKDTLVVNTDVNSAPVNLFRETLTSITATCHASNNASKPDMNYDSSSKQFEQSASKSFCFIDCCAKFKSSQMFTKHGCSKVEQSASRNDAFHQDSKSLRTNVNKACKHGVFDVEKSSANNVKQTHNTIQSKFVHCLKCHKLFSTRLLLVQHKRSGICSATAAIPLVEAKMWNTHNRQRKLVKVCDKKSSKSKRNNYPAASSREDSFAKFQMNSSAVSSSVDHHEELDKKYQKSENMVECTESQSQTQMTVNSFDVLQCGGEVIDAARVIEDIPCIDVSLSLKKLSIDSLDTKVASHINSGLLNTKETSQNQRMNCNPTCIGEVESCKRENEPWNGNWSMLSADGCPNKKPKKMKSETPESLTSTYTSELKTEELKSVMVRPAMDVEQASMLRALYLIPFEECLSPRKEAATISNTDAGRRKRKCILTKFDPSDLPKSTRKTGAKKIIGVKNDRQALAPVSVQHIKNSRIRSKSKKCGAPKAKKTSEAKKTTISKTKESGINSRKQRATSVNVGRSIRTLEPVSDNALRCVVCSVLLRTIRQIIAHVCL